MKMMMMMMMMVMIMTRMRMRMRMMMMMMVMLLMLLLLVMMMMMMRERWGCGCWGGGRRWSSEWMMFRRETDPKTAGKHTLCEPAQSKCTRTFHKRFFCAKILRKSAVRQSRDTRFVRASAVQTHMDMSQEPFCVKKYRGNGVRDDRTHRYHLEWTPGLNTCRKNPSVWPHCSGNINMHACIHACTHTVTYIHIYLYADIDRTFKVGKRTSLIEWT